MNKVRFLIMILLTAASIVIVAGCSKDKNDNNPITPGGGNTGNGSNGSQASVFINGEGFNLLQLIAKDGAAYYSADDNATYTSIVTKSGSDTLMVLLATKGKAKGEYNWNDSEGISYLIIANDDEYISYVSINSGITTITEYGEVNGYVKGTFSGSVYKDANGDPVDIDGSFSIKRIADQ